MSRWTLLMLSALTAGLAILVFLYTFWLRIIQTGDSTAEAWNPVLWVVAVGLLVAGLIRRP
jgi:hypothetical protein